MTNLPCTCFEQQTTDMLFARCTPVFGAWIRVVVAGSAGPKAAPGRGGRRRVHAATLPRCHSATLPSATLHMNPPERHTHCRPRVFMRSPGARVALSRQPALRRETFL